MPKAVFITGLQPDLANEFVSQAPEHIETTLARHDIPVSEKLALVSDVDYLILFRPNRIEDEVLRASPHLKLLQLVSAGFEHIDLTLCHSLGIPVANNGGTNSIDVAEHTLALMLGIYRRLIDLHAEVEAKDWGAIPTGECTYTIHGKTVGIIGLGHIGRQVAERLKPFGPRLLYSDVAPAGLNVEKSLDITYVSREELLEQADIVTLHVPINDATRNMIDAPALARMKPTAILINTCRGGVIDEPALADALASGGIAFAGLDVLAQEPPDPDNKLLGLPNVLLTPHTAGITRDTWTRRGKFVYENVDRVIRGEAPLSRVDGL
jgi:phosphoglycerate dehydrogenase-like enzyme